jgi:hypothetical protein
VPSLYRIACTISAPNSNPGANIFHVGNTNSGDTGISTVVGHIKTFYDAIASFYTTTTAITIAASVRDINVTPNRIVAVSSVQSVGTSTAEILPANAALVVTWRTALAGRSFRGRTYLGPSNETVNNGGIANATTVSTIQTAANTLITNIAAVTGFTLGVYSKRRTQPPESLSPLFATTNVTSATVNGLWDSQRRRQP